MNIRIFIRTDYGFRNADKWWLMIYYDNLYISDELKKDEKEIINFIRAGKLYKNVYIIYLNDDTGKPELMHGIFFNQIYMQTKRVKILGITDRKADGVNYISRYTSNMLGAVYDEAD